MKRIAISLCWLGLALFALDTAALAAPAGAPAGNGDVVKSCGQPATGVAPAAKLPAFLAGAKLADTCGLTTCTQARAECRTMCGEALCSIGFFSCPPGDPCLAQCQCFCE